MRISYLRRHLSRTRHLLQPLAHSRGIATSKDALSLDSFRKHVLSGDPEPLVWPGHYQNAPAIQKWFATSRANADAKKLNAGYLRQWSDAVVPVEITRDDQFSRVEMPLSVFIDMLPEKPAGTGLYIAQCSVADLPKTMQEDVPTPHAVLSTGKGDIYGTSIWIGEAPTYTPLHRDPNPNLLVQLAGHKVVRLMTPSIGNGTYRRVRKELRLEGHSHIRGEDMMAGPQRELMNKYVWGDNWAEELALEQQDPDVLCKSVEVRITAGDALFIPLGWWHSVRGVGSGITASVNWWWR